MTMMGRLKISTTFRSVKKRDPVHRTSLSCQSKSKNPSVSTSISASPKQSWLVYLILSTSIPIKTYVGVTTNFDRRLKQHNGELKGGAKASRVGRPWVCACLIRGFYDRSEACEFESRWKIFCRKISRKKKTTEMVKQEDDASVPLLQHRQAALDRVKNALDCSHLEINWQLNFF